MLCKPPWRSTLPCQAPGQAPVGLTLAGLAGSDARVLGVGRSVAALLASVAVMAKDVLYVLNDGVVGDVRDARVVEVARLVPGEVGSLAAVRLRPPQLGEGQLQVLA